MMVILQKKFHRLGKCEEAFEYGVSRNMQTRDVGRFFSG